MLLLLLACLATVTANSAHSSSLPFLFDSPHISHPSSNHSLSTSSSSFIDPQRRTSALTIDTTNYNFPGFTFLGENSQSSGFSVANVGDFNGDGFEDIVIGVPLASPNGIIYAGAAYVVFGKRSGYFPTDEPIDLSDVPLYEDGFAFFGTPNAQCGNSVAGAGDINGDLLSDIIIGCPYGGVAYVIFGRSSSDSFEIDLADSAFGGFAIYGDLTTHLFAYSVHAAGDLNDDSHDDVIIGCILTSNYHVAAVVVYGTGDSYLADHGPIEIDSLTPKTRVKFTSYIRISSYPGPSLSGGVDVNNDGMDDILIGIPGLDPYHIFSAGVAYVVFGHKNGFSSTSLDLSKIGSDGFNGFWMYGGINYRVGYSIAGGDMNGDGISDVIVGASEVGLTYVIFGGKKLNGMVYNLGTGSFDGFTIKGFSADHIGWSVSSGGDVNGDGIDDLVDSARSNVQASVYVIYGKRSFTSGDILDLTQQFDESDGIQILGSSVQNTATFGRSVALSNFVKGPTAQVIIGDSNYNLDSGRTLVLSLGTPYQHEVVVNLAKLSKVSGKEFGGAEANDYFGYSVSGLGDVNGDKVGDFIMGAPKAVVGGRSLDMTQLRENVTVAFPDFFPSLPLAPLAPIMRSE